MSIRFYFSACFLTLLCLTLTASATEKTGQPKSTANKTAVKVTATKPAVKLSTTKTSTKSHTAKTPETRKASLKSTSTKPALASNTSKTPVKAREKKATLASKVTKVSLKSNTAKPSVKPRKIEAVAQKKSPAKTELAQPKKTNATALFAVSQNQKGVFLDPIVLIQNGRFISPPTSDATTAQLTKFASTYYRAEQKYRLLFGGGDAGNVTVKQWNLRKECSRTQASAQLDSSAKISGKVMGLATNSTGLGKREPSRRFPTEKEKDAIFALAEKTYRQKGVTESELKDLKRINITATDLNNDGKAEIIGTFMVKRSKAARVAHILFLITEPYGKTYKVGASQYGQITAGDVGGTDKLDELGETALAEILVDQIDLDKDGTAEVIIADLTAEGVAYKIFKKQKNLWRKAYEFYNLRCAN
jgi:hypothetical protein